MAVSTIAMYASPPSSTSHPCSVNSYDFDLSGRSSTSASSSPASTSQRTIVVGGLSRLLKNHSPSSGEEFTRGEDHLSSSFRCSSSLKLENQSPLSVLHWPVSVSSSYGSFGSSVRGGMLNGLMRSSLGSCLDYEVDQELTFDMEDSVSVMRGDHLLKSAQTRHNIFYDDFVIKAFYEAEKAHRGQLRASGHPYLQHCVETAVMLATIGADATVVAAGLLHDTIDDSSVTYDHILEMFGSEVADLVHGVSRLSHLSKLARENNTADKTVEADRLHTMFLAMADARAVLIKLADRLHNMMTLDALPMVKQLRFAKETLEIFAPLANRLGVSTWKERLENLCFKYLYPKQHEELSSKLVESFDEVRITSVIAKLDQALMDEDISFCDLSGRHKSLYSIYRKMMKKNLTMDQIHDIHGLRLIVENEDDCFRALKVVHQLWSEVPGKMKDYIHCPKFNGYKSLHTVVVGEGMVPLEVQIRTREMHLQAEFGFAAHWRYKEGDCEHSSFILQMVEWARWVVTWQCETMNKNRASSLKPTCQFPSHSEGCPFSYKHPCNEDGPVFVIMIENDKMSVQEFSANSTVMDLLDRTGHSIHRALYGFPVKQELRPRLNHATVSDPSCKLKMGDVIELTPPIPHKSLTEYRKEMQRMYNRGPRVSTMAGWRG